MAVGDVMFIARSAHKGLARGLVAQVRNLHLVQPHLLPLYKSDSIRHRTASFCKVCQLTTGMLSPGGHDYIEGSPFYTRSKNSRMEECCIIASSYEGASHLKLLRAWSPYDVSSQRCSVSGAHVGLPGPPKCPVYWTQNAHYLK